MLTVEILALLTFGHIHGLALQSSYQSIPYSLLHDWKKQHYLIMYNIQYAYKHARMCTTLNTQGNL